MSIKVADGKCRVPNAKWQMEKSSDLQIWRYSDLKIKHKTKIEKIVETRIVWI